MNFFIKILTVFSLCLIGLNTRCSAQNFAKIYGNGDENHYFNSIYSSINKAYYVVGFDRIGGYQPTLSKIDLAGNLVWVKKYQSGLFLFDISEIIAADSSSSDILISGSRNGTTDLYMYRLNANNGNVVWANRYSSNFSFDYPHMVVAKNKIIISGTTSNGFAFSQINFDGNIQWSNYYQIYGDEPTLNGFLAYNELSGIACTYKTASRNGVFSIKEDGSINYCLSSSKNYYYRNISSTGNGFLVTALQNFNSSYDNQILLRIDQTGNLSWAKFLKSTITPSGTCNNGDPTSVTTSSGNILYVTNSCFSGNSKYNFITLNATGNLISSKVSTTDSLSIYYITNLVGNSVGIMGSSNKKSGCINSTNANGLFSVFNNTSNFCDLVDFNTLNVSNDNVTLTKIPSQNLTATPFSLTKTNIANTNTNIIYNQVNYCNEPKLVSLGPDISGCFSSTVNLNAGTGFKTYQWSTGAATPQISVNGNGTFWVKVTDNCNTISSDTIVITKGVGQNSSKNYALCQGDSIKVGAKVYKSSGTYIDTLANINGCDSIVTSNITVTPAKQFTQSKTICKGQSFQVGTSTYTTSGTFTNTFSTAQGCDSIVTTNLTVTPAKQFTQSKTICKGQSFQVGSSIYTTSGTFTNTFSTAQGCDSIVTTLLTVTPVYNKTITPSICKGNSFTVGSNSYSQSGTYLDTLRSIANCDSIIQTILTVINPTTIAIQPIICKGEVFNVGNQQYTSAGNYIDTLISSLGCDSIIQTSLTVKNTLSTTLNDSICAGETYFFNGQAINNSGIYNSTLISSLGCDSIVTLTLSLLPNPQVIASANPYSIFEGGNIQLLTFSDSSVFQYNWSPATGLSNPSISAPIATPETSTIYIVEVTYINGCISSDTVRINVFDPCNLQIPNAFTPNGDGINDCFKILGFNDFDNFSCMIFDRWGEKVFESNNPNICWDGKYKNENAPMDSYFYIVRFDCNKTARKVKGMVSLLR